MKRITISRREKTTTLLIDPARFWDGVATFACVLGLIVLRRPFGGFLIWLGGLF